MGKKRRKGGGMPRQRTREEKTNRAKLELWQKRLGQSDTAFAPEVEKMDKRELTYMGDRNLDTHKKCDADKSILQTDHVRNIVFENLESMVSSSLPQPKVTAIRKEDEYLANIIERFLRNEMDRLPFERLNDMAERTVPIQGGGLFWPEWNELARDHSAGGRMEISFLHPKQLAPQPGVFTGIRDMDWFILKIPTTKEAVQRRYGINVRSEGEAEPQIRGAKDINTAEDALTQYVGYERSREGTVNKFSWVNDTVLEDLDDYQARRQPVCTKCGRIRPMPGQVISSGVTQLTAELAPEEDTQLQGQAMAEMLAQQVMETGSALQQMPVSDKPEPERRYDGGACPWCGADAFEERTQEYEEVIVPIRTQAGKQIPGATMGFDESGQPVAKPTLIPFYKPDVYPVVLQRSVSVFGQLLGNSDVDAIADQQNTIKRLERKIIDRLLKAGSKVTLPNNPRFRADGPDREVWYLDKPADKNMIDMMEFKGDLRYELSYLNIVYEEARQILGITDSFQGRRDPTATSGKAKEYAASLAAGRLESKRVMKNAAYAEIFEIMFKFALAYSDEPRPVSYKNARGDTEYAEFNRYDFLEQDADGNYYWNDKFLFSVDTSAPLERNREAMWQELRMNLQTGAFGDPTKTETLILFWSKMEEQHYPGASQTKQHLEERANKEREAQKAMLTATGGGTGNPIASGTGAEQIPGIPGQI